MSTKTVQPLFPAAGNDRSAGVPGKKKLGARYFPGSVSGALLSASSKYLGINLQSDGTTKTELALAVAASIHPSKYEQWTADLNFQPTVPAAVEIHKKMIEAMGLRFKGMIDGSFPDAEVVKAFDDAFEAWKDTPEGKQRSGQVRRFAAPGSTVSSSADADPFEAMAAAGRAAQRAGRSTGQKAAQQLADLRRDVKAAIAGKQTIKTSQMAALLGDDE